MKPSIDLKVYFTDVRQVQGQLCGRWAPPPAAESASAAGSGVPADRQPGLALERSDSAPLTCRCLDRFYGANPPPSGDGGQATGGPAAAAGEEIDCIQGVASSGGALLLRPGSPEAVVHAGVEEYRVCIQSFLFSWLLAITAVESSIISMKLLT